MTSVAISSIVAMNQVYLLGRGRRDGSFPYRLADQSA
jgi:hypothetical protein